MQELEKKFCMLQKTVENLFIFMYNI